MTSAKKWGIVTFIVFVLCFYTKPAICPIVIGCFVLYIGIATIIFLTSIKKKGVECIGTILTYESDGDGYKTPIIEFTTWTGEIVTEKPYVYASTDLSKLKTYRDKFNQPIQILYDPKNPKRFVLAGEEQFNYLIFIITILAGLAFIGIGICVFLGYINFN